MAWKGAFLAANIGMSNQSGTLRFVIPGGENAAAPDTDELRNDVDKIFTGKVINISYTRYQLTDAEKAAFTGVNPARYALVNYAVTFGKYGRKNRNTREFYAGFSKTVDPADITAWVIANREMADGTAPEYVIIGRAIPVV